MGLDRPTATKREGVGRREGMGVAGKKATKEAFLKMSADERVETLKRKQVCREIRQDLLDQLDRNGTVGKYYIDLIEDYMDMWVTKSLLITDIHERGAYIPYDNGGGQKGTKKNDSVELVLKINAQMLKLLAEIGIKPSQASGEEDEL